MTRMTGLLLFCTLTVLSCSQAEFISGKEITSLAETVEAWRDCGEPELYTNLLVTCTISFVTDLLEAGNESICLWPVSSSSALWPYSRLVACTHQVGYITNCREAILVNRFMLGIHKSFYADCPVPPVAQRDAPTYVSAIFITITTSLTVATAALLASGYLPNRR
ncbi:receptor activity-modifying protein 1-like [Branchiostoma floridae]|uniref:Receptor activity-modifying protein 1-like n=1 Tax=Branchiostoma floridae TaxID=7739 RepID=A0A9J7N381_BRAFL|nr:receptor activity-modifying protein 1-like [Branchiostoma floridae]